MRFAKLMIVAMILVGAAALAAQTNEKFTDEEAAGNQAIAERSAQMAQGTLSGK